MTNRTADAMALDIILSNAPKRVRDARLAALLKAANASIGVLCPHCGASEDAIQDNSASGPHLVYLCIRCEHQWGPGTEV